jgi:hypothetical protein
MPRDCYVLADTITAAAGDRCKPIVRVNLGSCKEPVSLTISACARPYFSEVAGLALVFLVLAPRHCAPNRRKADERRTYPAMQSHCQRLSGRDHLRVMGRSAGVS